MTKGKRGNVAKVRRKKILSFAKGFKGAHSRLFRTANGQVMKALVYSYVGRKNSKRNFRKLWISRVNAAVQSKGLTYSRFRNSLKRTSINLNVKVLSQLSILDKETFDAIVYEIK